MVRSIAVWLAMAVAGMAATCPSGYAPWLYTTSGVVAACYNTTTGAAWYFGDLTDASIQGGHCVQMAATGALGDAGGPCAVSTVAAPPANFISAAANTDLYAPLPITGGVSLLAANALDGGQWTVLNGGANLLSTPLAYTPGHVAITAAGGIYIAAYSRVEASGGTPYSCSNPQCAFVCDQYSPLLASDYTGEACVDLGQSTATAVDGLSIFYDPTTGLIYHVYSLTGAGPYTHSVYLSPIPTAATGVFAPEPSASATLIGSGSNPELIYVGSPSSAAGYYLLTTDTVTGKIDLARSASLSSPSFTAYSSGTLATQVPANADFTLMPLPSSAWQVLWAGPGASADGVSISTGSNPVDPGGTWTATVVNAGTDFTDGVMAVPVKAQPQSMTNGLFLASPSSGSGLPVFRAITEPDLPGINGSPFVIVGTTAGDAYCAQPFFGTVYGKALCYLAGYENATATAQTWSFPTAFTQMPWLAQDATAGASVSATMLTLPASMGSAVTGWVVVNGW